MPNVRNMVKQYEEMVQKRNGGGTKPSVKPPDPVGTPLVDPLASPLVDPLATSGPSLTTPTVTTPPTTTPTVTTAPTTPPTTTPPKTTGSLGAPKSNKDKKTWSERNDAKPWDVDYKTFAKEGHTSHHLIPDNSLLSLGGHITKMGLWGQKDTKEFTDEFIMRDVLNNTDPSKHEALKEKLSKYKAKTKRTTGELGGKTEVEDTGLQGVLHDGMNEALDDDDLKDFTKKFQGAFEWRPANTVLGPTSSLRWDDPKDGFDVPATLLAYGNKSDTEEIAQNSKNIKAFTSNNDTSTAPGQLATIMKGLTKQNRKGESLTGKDTQGRPLPFMTDRKDWIEKNKSNQGDLDKYDEVTKEQVERVGKSSGGVKAAERVEKTRNAKRPALVSKDGFVTNTNPLDVEDIRTRLNV